MWSSGLCHLPVFVTNVPENLLRRLQGRNGPSRTLAVFYPTTRCHYLGDPYPDLYYYKSVEYHIKNVDVYSERVEMLVLYLVWGSSLWGSVQQNIFPIGGL